MAAILPTYHWRDKASQISENIHDNNLEPEALHDSDNYRVYK